MALWRMDWTLAPLIAQEITRPSYTYKSFLAAPPAKGGKGEPRGSRLAPVDPAVAIRRVEFRCRGQRRMGLAAESARKSTFPTRWRPACRARH